MELGHLVKFSPVVISHTLHFRPVRCTGGPCSSRGARPSRDKYIVHFEHLIYVKPLHDGILHLSLLLENCGQWSILSVRTSLVRWNDWPVDRPRPLTLNCPDFTKPQACCFLQSGYSISIFSFYCSFTR
jgi:hypothetical protein